MVPACARIGGTGNGQSRPVARTTPPAFRSAAADHRPGRGRRAPSPVRFPSPAGPPREDRPAIGIVPDKGAVSASLDRSSEHHPADPRAAIREITAISRRGSGCGAVRTYGSAPGRAGEQRPVDAAETVEITDRPGEREPHVERRRVGRR
ncbi:hypothetical protein GCM10009735_03430 [Actinomadura chokoriensis]